MFYSSLQGKPFFDHERRQCPSLACRIIPADPLYLRRFNDNLFLDESFSYPVPCAGPGSGIKSLKLFFVGVCLGLSVSIIYGIVLFMASGKAEAGSGKFSGRSFLNILSALGLAFGEELLFRVFPGRFQQTVGPDRRRSGKQLAFRTGSRLQPRPL